jgi:ABC-type multidrug transport system fused ATPase/permease subunit
MIDGKTLRMAWALLDARERRRAWLVLAVVILSALSAAFMVGSVLPFLTVLAQPERIREVPALAWAYEMGGFESDYWFLVALGVASALVILTASLLQILRVWVLTRFAMMRMHSISHRLLSRYLRQPYEFFLDRHSGTMGTKILAEAQQAVVQFLSPAADVVASSLTVLAIVGLLLWVDAAVALSAFAVFGGIYVGAFLLTRRGVDRLGRVRAAANQARYRIVGEAFGGTKDIKLLGREGTYVDRYAIPSERMVRAESRSAVLQQTPHYVMQAVAFCGVILLSLVLLDPAGLESGEALGGLLPILGLLAFAGQRMMPELSRVYQGLVRLRYGAAAVEAVYQDLVALPQGDELPRHPPAPIGLRASLTLEDVSYRYPQAEVAGLHGVSMTVQAGEKIGIVGTTGAGKTTFADIVLGLLRPASGRLVVDGTPIDAARLRAWQRSVGYVPQDIFLTDASIAENIALGVPPEEIDQARVEEAARIARIDDFVRCDLPEGYATSVGERGVRLSGGQRQRVGIARALYHDADLIVFDEATSALDNLTEREVMAAIESLPGDKTILMIAHRLSTVRVCDRIVVLDRGRIADLGSWDELMERSDVFRSIAVQAA